MFWPGQTCARPLAGRSVLLVSVFAEIFYAAMLAPMMAVAHTLFMGGLLFGKTIGWGAQARGVQRLPVKLVCQKLWPQTLFGLAGLWLWLSGQPIDLVWPVIPVAIGPLLATVDRGLPPRPRRSEIWPSGRPCGAFRKKQIRRPSWPTCTCRHSPKDRYRRQTSRASFRAMPNLRQREVCDPEAGLPTKL